MATQIQVRRDTEGDWNTADPTLAQGEIGVIVGSSGEITGLKVGDGSTAWIALKLALPMLSGVPNILEESTTSANQPVGGTDSAGDKTTFLLKGLSAQNAAVFGIEATDSTTLVLSIDKAGGITAAAGVNVSGGYDGTNDTYGITIDTNGNVQSNTGIESGDYIADCTTGGVLLSTDVPAAPDGTDPTYGKLEISVKSGVTATDNVIAVRNNNAQVFVVDADGDIAKVKNITATGLTTTVGLTNSGAVINAGTQKITSVVDPTHPQGAATKAYVDARTTPSLKTYASCYFTLKNSGTAVPLVGSLINLGNVASVVGTGGGQGTKYCTITFTTPMPHATNWIWKGRGGGYPVLPAFGSVPMGNTTWTVVQTSASVITMSAAYIPPGDGPFTWYFDIVGTTLEN